MIPASLLKILDSAAFRAFFALWTGLYLVQVIKGQEGAPIDELWWIIIGFAIALFII
jgi:hypothetical protein